MNREKSSLANQGNENRIIKRDRGSISHFERRKRMSKCRPSEFDQLIKFSKRSSLTYSEEKNIQKVFYLKKEMKSK